jgi:hypothetical protein
MGNGGRVFVDSAYLYQGGSIYANGVNGGLIQFNVGSMTMGPNASIEAKGLGNGYGGGGNGGQVFINSAGTVDLKPGSIVDTSGKVVANYDTNLINIEGSVVNVQGVLKANGTDASRGGTISLVANGNSHSACTDCAVDSVSKIKDPTISADLAAQIKADHTALAKNHDGKLMIGKDAKIEANGANGTTDSRNGKNGGTVLLTAAHSIDWLGSVKANGGHGLHGISGSGNGGAGGTIAASAQKDINFSGEAHAIGGNGYQSASNNVVGGFGGKGGVIGFSYGGAFNNTYVASKNSLTLNQIDVRAGNNAIIWAKERHIPVNGGGLVVFSGDKNPTRFDNVSVNPGVVGYGQRAAKGNFFGTIVAPEFTSSNFNHLPASVKAEIRLANPSIGRYDAHVAKTADTEVLLHNENMIVLSKGGPHDLQGKVNSSTIRTVDMQSGLGYLPGGTTPYNLFIANIGNGLLTLNHPCHCKLDLGNLHTMTVSNAGGGILNPAGTYWKVGIFDSHVKDPRAAIGGGHLSWLANGDIKNDTGAHILSYGNVAGGSINLSSLKGDVHNKGTIALVADPYADDYAVHHHAGSMIFTATKDITNTGLITDEFGLSFGKYGHKPTGPVWGIGQMLQARAGQDFINKGRIIANGRTPILSRSSVFEEWSYKAYDGESDYPVMTTNPSLSAWGGIIEANATRNAINLDLVQANGKTYGKSAPIYYALAKSGEEAPKSYGAGYGGYVHLGAGNVATNGLPGRHHNAKIDAEGTQFGGKVLLTAAGNDQGGLGSGIVPGITDTATDLTPGINRAVGESVWNFGHIDTHGGQKDGTIVLAGDKAVGLGLNSKFNHAPKYKNTDGYFDFMNKAQSHGGTVSLLTGPGVVKELLCGKDTPLTPDSPNSPTVKKDGVIDPNLLGLFQQNRYFNEVKQAQTQTPIILAMQKPGMFLAKKYSKVTEEILKLALYEYNRELSQGQTKAEAFRLSTQYLRLAGIDADIAKTLISQIQAKTIDADVAIIPILQQLATELTAKAAIPASTVIK